MPLIYEYSKKKFYNLHRYLAYNIIKDDKDVQTGYAEYATTSLRLQERI